MKTIITKNKKWTLVVLLGLATFSHSHTYTTDISTKMVKEVIIPYLHKQTSILSSFFDATKKTPYKAHIDHIDKNKKEYSATIERYTRTPDHISPLFDKVLTLAHYIEDKFKPLFDVLTKHNGQKNWLGLIADLKPVLQKDVIFKEITEFLAQLYDQAKAENNVSMMNAVGELKEILRVKDLEWTKKSPEDLTTGIITRMKH